MITNYRPITTGGLDFISQDLELHVTTAKRFYLLHSDPKIMWHDYNLQSSICVNAWKKISSNFISTATWPGYSLKTRCKMRTKFCISVSGVTVNVKCVSMNILIFAWTRYKMRARSCISDYLFTINFKLCQICQTGKRILQVTLFRLSDEDEILYLRFWSYD